MHKYTSIVLILLSIFISSELSAEGNHISINPKVSFYNIGMRDDDGLVAGIETSLKTQKHIIYSLDYYRYWELDFAKGPKPAEHYNQIGAMIGKFNNSKLFHLHYQGGLSLFWGEERTSTEYEDNHYTTEDFVTCGFVANVGFRLTPLKWFSIGADIQTNINSKNSVYMPFVCIGFHLF